MFNIYFAGPALLFFDAFFLNQAFTDSIELRHFAFFINSGYFGWLEIFVQPNSDFPAGKITASLPYPFMNDMSFEHRLVFMLMCFIFGALLIWILTNAHKKYSRSSFYATKFFLIERLVKKTSIFI